MPSQDESRFTVRVTDEAVQSLIWLQQATGLSRSKIVDILARNADITDLEPYQHLWKDV